MSASGSVVDLSGVTVVTVAPVVAPVVSALNTQFLQVLTELLQNKPQTTADALALYHSVTVQLSAHLVGNLPPLEQKAAALAMWAVQEVESGKCVPASFMSFLPFTCVPK